MIVYLEIPPEKFVELKKRYPISRNENNGRLYFDTDTLLWYVYEYGNTLSVARLCCREVLLG